MKELIYTFFVNYKDEIIFLHVISAVIWVGGMVALRYAAHQSIQQLQSPLDKLQRTAYALKRLFVIVAPFIVIILLTAIIMAVGFGFRSAAIGPDGNVINSYAMHIYNIVNIKESIWTIMTFNYRYMVFRRNKAQKLIDNGNLVAAKAALAPIGAYFVPINIALGVLAIYLGVILQAG
jgi:uncharacterized membrane protein